MTVLIALAVSIGLLAVVATWVFLGPLAAFQMQIWQAFIAWACFFHTGGDETALKRTIAGNIFGAIMAWVAAMLILNVPLGDTLGLPLWASIVVGLTVFVMVLASQVGALSVIPAAVYGYAAVFAYLLQTAEAMVVGKLLGVDVRANPVLVIIISMLLGALFGFASAKLAGALTRKSATVPA
jgi:hypothetical protein